MYRKVIFNVSIFCRLFCRNWNCCCVIFTLFDTFGDRCSIAFVLLPTGVRTTITMMSRRTPAHHSYWNINEFNDNIENVFKNNLLQTNRVERRRQQSIQTAQRKAKVKTRFSLFLITFAGNCCSPINNVENVSQSFIYQFI
jgi:hypothetical protein